MESNFLQRIARLMEEMMRGFTISAAVLLGIVVASPAWAVHQCKPTKKDTRICDVPYDPNDVVEFWGAVGVQVTVQLAPDEGIIWPPKVADGVHIKIGGAPGGNFVTIKFLGCVVPEPLTFLTKKGSETRPYIFQVETIPTQCITPPPASDKDKEAEPNLVAVGLAQPPFTIGPNLKYLPTADALGPGGNIPFLIRFTYPGDDAARARKLREAEEAQIRSQQVAGLLKTASQKGTSFSPVKRTLYYGNGDGSLMPNETSDDGNITTFKFPPNLDIPIITAPLNPTARCTVEGQEANTRPETAGQTVTIAGTKQLWCLRAPGGRVLELWNASYSPTGGNAGATTNDPRHVVREIRGADDGR